MKHFIEQKLTTFVGAIQYTMYIVVLTLNSLIINKLLYLKNCPEQNQPVKIFFL
jgi:hypothetical protein